MRRLVTLAVAAAAVVAVGFAWRAVTALPDGPEPVAWDKAACGECRMHVGDKRFAAQLQTKGGQVLEFDDPGCLFNYLEHKRPAVHATWFRHLREDRWVRGDQAGFVEAEQSPMGHGLGAVDRGAPGDIGVEQAIRKVTGEESADAR